MRHRTEAAVVQLRVAIAAALATLIVLLVSAADAPARAFPRDFQWGVAIAGFQAEPGQGRNLDPGTDWWAWTHDPENIGDRTVTSDRPEDGPGFLARSRTDLRLAANSLNLKAFRMGIEWSRVFPRSTAGADGLKALDRIANKRAIRRYRAILRRARDLGLTPWVTINHFALPGWIHDPIASREALRGVPPDAALPPLERGGWLDRRTIGEFRKYAGYLAWKLGDEVDRWITLNEPMVVAVNGYVNIPGVVEGNFPPGAFTFTGAIEAIINMADANASAYKAVKRRDRGSRVGFVHNMVAFTAADPASPRDVAGAAHAEYLFDRLFMDAAVRGIRDRDADGVVDPGERNPRQARKADFVGLNYYFRGRVTGLASSITSRIPLLDFLPSTSYASPSNPSGAPCPTTCTEFGWEIYPEGFRHVLGIAGGYGLPVIVTENGISDSNDDQRAAYLVSHLRAMRQAMRAREARVGGYFHWTLVDNFEWAAGYTQRFGLFGYDPATLRRTMRPSARVYARIARTGRLP
ncbi:MAG TPA: glycoside hydrolase family 1 protein [Solirubrobacterales bacterium]|nr:glycoside hydrolase family 1 protein [Solirubrobacterales bacterium]